VTLISKRIVLEKNVQGLEDVEITR
jgi:hypothetical protein